MTDADLGAALPLPVPSAEMQDRLAQRRSASAQSLAAPGPTRAEIERILLLGARTPDHGKLFPWRFVVLGPESRAALAAAIATHGRVIRIALAEVHGSAPREVGASMLVWSDGQSGTIGGGALEHEAIAAARRITAPTLINRALGPDLGQCCGGRVTLVLEPFTASSLAAIPETGSFTRPIAPAGPIALAPPDHPHALAQARATRDGKSVV